MLIEELNKLDIDQLKNISEIWAQIKIPKDKRGVIKLLAKVAIDDYFLKGVLEKLTPVQVKIYSVLVASKTILTLGEISRKVKLQPINVEKELAVLKHLMLVYQRKNRERITSNLDRYYPFEEIKSLVSVETNAKGNKFKISIKREIEQKGIEHLDKKYQTILGKLAKNKLAAEKSITTATFEKIIKLCSESELKLLDEAFNNGGIIEIYSARIVCDEQKLNPEKTFRKLHNLNVLKDLYFIDERFVRVLVIPLELFDYLKINPIFYKDEGIKELQEKTISNNFDFVLNMKKLLLFISNKGLTLAQSEKIKQADMKKSESGLIDIDKRLFPEKSQVHQIEILLPFLKMFDLISLKGENIVLTEKHEDFLKRQPLQLIKEIVIRTHEFAEKRQVGNEVFLPIDIPFYKKELLKKIIKIIAERKGLYNKVLLSELIRDWVVLSPGFKVREFKSSYIETRSAILSVLFYMHLFGMLEIEYPKRFVRLSELGEHYFHKIEISLDNSPGGIIINPDATLIALPDKLSIYDLHMLKSFAELIEYDRIYNFKITKESLQEGILLGQPIDTFLEFLKVVSKNKIPQNVMFLISDWTEDLPIVTIEEGVVILETSNAKLTEALLGQIKGKKIVRRELSDTALLIDKTKVNEVMDVAEKLEMIVKLVR